MSKCSLLWPAVASLSLVVSLQAANYAGAVIAYDPGTGAGKFTNAASALGEPARQTADPQFGTFPVDVFGPPYLTNQIVALGAGGSLTLQFNPPLTNDPANPYGLDFIVFGNAFFQFNSDFTTTSGALGGTNTGATAVWVSADGNSFYQLDPSAASPLDALYPTDGSGNFGKPVNPALSGRDFAGKDLAGIRQLYAGSGGGTGFDISWARDVSSNSVALPQVRYVRFDQLSGTTEIDGVAAVSTTEEFREDFSSDPLSRGWRLFGDPSLFHWNTTNQDLEVTWDTEKTNAYFARPLGTILTKSDDFTVAFDLRLDDLALAFTNGYAFELSVGLLKWADATGVDFNRASGTNSPNLVEFDYFPDTGFGATISPTIVSSNSQFATSFTFPLPLTPDSRFHIALSYTATNQTLATIMTRDGELFEPVKETTLTASFTDFRVDTLAVSSYRDNDLNGSILAHGIVDNFVVTVPRSPVSNVSGGFTNGVWQTAFTARVNWWYTLERTADFQSWIPASPSTPGIDGRMILADTNSVSTASFYRVHAERP